MGHFAYKPERLRFLKKEEMAQLLNGPRSDGSARDYYLLAVMYALGLRVGEAVRLRAEFFDFDAKEVLVPTLKRKRDAHKFQIDPVLNCPMLPVPILSHEALLRRMVEWGSRRKWIFEGARPEKFLCERRATLIFKNWVNKTGLDYRISSHSLRHSAGTVLYAATRDIVLVSKFLRHSSVQTTMHYYLHVLDAEKAKGALNL